MNRPIFVAFMSVFPQIPQGDAKALLTELRAHLSLLPAVGRQREAQTQQVTEQRRAEDPSHGHFGPAPFGSRLDRLSSTQGLWQLYAIMGGIWSGKYRLEMVEF